MILLSETSEASTSTYSPLLSEAEPIRNDNEKDNIRLCKSVGTLMELGDQLSQGTHATTYSLIWRRTGEIVDGFNARVYGGEGTSDKLKRYRSRNLKRWLGMNSAVIKSKWGDSSVVVYFVNQDARQKWSVESGSILRHSLSEKSKLGQETIEAEPKSDHKKEVSRLRQAEKRREKRRIARMRNTSVLDSPADETHQENGTKDDGVLSTILVLASKLGNKADEWDKLSPELSTELKSQIEEYPKLHEIEFTSLESIRASLKCKEHELIYLKRLEKRLFSLIIRRHDELKQDIQVHRPMSTKGQHQAKTNAMWKELNRLPGAMSIISGIIYHVSYVVTNLKQHLHSLEQQWGTCQEQRNLTERKSLLESIARSMRQAASAVIPGSAIRVQLTRRCEEIEKEIHDIEEDYSKLAEKNAKSFEIAVSDMLTIEVKALTL
ncbi:hypothetical protein F4821DRAFT_239590 [Hypoxylon rubiginosum]|uniref:Uncharacterized protein n=1 Tax=Hypoxylon rubiginosum TaxID=110542 RepID=A0ACC0CZW0_9PEZI|nr:hypothetical protein F4821DRAFT_239590 [Hypoxylon rubiginosum]